MATLLLASKLYLPPVRPGRVLRLRLLQQLDKALQCKLTLLSAPAGFGKTTLLADWAGGLTGRAQIAWLSIDEADNDPTRFFEYLVAALQHVVPDLVAPPPATAELPRHRFEPLLTLLLNQLANLPTPLALVLDDYHLIEEPTIHQAIDFLLERQPPHFHLIIATRADPPLHLSRLRGRDQLNEVRLADLRFTPQEAAAFLSQAMGLSLTSQQIAALAARTEGWIAGLQLAALSLRGQQDPEQFVKSFAGSTHFILDYLSDEVFQAQPAPIQDFLLHTAILDRLSGPLCDAVCQLSPGLSQKTLDYLEHANLFILPLDDRQEWYRYHQLFADLLRQRLGQDRPDLISTLYQRASAWCTGNDLPHEAIEYALSAGDPEYAADLIEGVSQGLLMHGRSATLLRWLERLPPELLDRRLTLVADHAWALLLCSRPIESVQNRLDRLDALSPEMLDGAPSNGRSFSTRTLPLRGMVALYRGQLDQALELSLHALSSLEADQIYLRGVAGLVHAISLSAGDDLEPYYLAVRHAAATGEKTGNLLVTTLALLSLAETEKKLGRLHQAHTHLGQAVQFARDDQGRLLPIAGRALIGLGDLAREWNDLEQAHQLCQEGISLMELSELAGVFHGYTILARLAQASGDVAASRHAIQKARQAAIAFDLTDLDDLVVALIDAHLAVLQGDLAAALRWAETRQLLSKTGLTLEGPSGDRYPARLRKYELVVLARLWLALAKPRQALSLLATLFTEFERVDRPAMRIEIRLLQALAYDALDERARSLDALEQTLTWAEPEGYVRTFLDEGTQLIALLRRAAARPAPDRPASLTAYLHRLLAAAGELAMPPPPRAPAVSLIEPLSDREMEVLRLLSGSLSAAEIAARLVVSPNTVHSHIKSIYAKLDVHSRYQAIERARALSLL